MKNSILKLSLLLATALMFTAAFAQVSIYERQPGYWTLGINGGFAYQQSDVPSTLEGYGLGLTLGKNLYYRPGAAFAFDLRGRGLYTKTYGLDYFQSFGIENNSALNGTNGLDYTKSGGGPGFVYQNNKTDHVELGLEGVVTFNKLREETNVIFSLFGGIGIDWYNTKIDQADVNGIYSPQYEGLNPTASVSYKKSELKNAILDGIYETNAQGFEGGNGRVGLMPGVGFELGYQFTPRFSMGVGHKVTFTKTDLFDGQQWTNDDRLTGDNDIHHYTNLHMNWILQGKEKELEPPVIKIEIPEIDPVTTRDPNGYVKANIKHVKSAMDVRFTVNGYSEQFNFNNEKFSSNFRLVPGRNDILISASNLAGTDQESVVIFYEEPVITYPQDRRPNVDITNPPYDDFRTDNDRFLVKATITNVYDSRDIIFTVDGSANYNFDFDSRTNTFSATIDLEKGQNEVRIEVSNNVGNDVDQTTIILEEVYQQLPVVDITRPYDDPHSTLNPTVSLEAKVYNVDSKDDIRFTINGRRSSDFTFVNETLFATIELYDYKTNVVVEANNSAGTASDDIVIFFEDQDDEPEEPVILAPVVTITSMSQPTIDPFDPDNCRSTVIATILNIENANDISFIVNGKKYYDFSFNAHTGVLQKTIKLELGSNEVVIKAQNEAGNDQDSATKEGCKMEENPPVVTITTPDKASITVTQPKTKIIATVLNINSKSDIELLVNGNRNSNFSFDINTKVFSATVSLLEGNNTVVIIAENKDGKAEGSVTILYKKPEVELALPPVVSIQTPANNSKVSVKEVRLEATALNITAKDAIQVFLNGNAIGDFGFNPNNQKVTAQLSLREGTNTIQVKATNEDGNDSKSVVVSFTTPVMVLPVVKITDPTAEVSTTSNPDVKISASIKNVEDKNSIKLTVNGKKDFGFTFKNNVLTADLKLAEGENTIVITVTNNDGSDEDQATITYQAPLILPVVKITTPANNTSAGELKTNVKATIQHVINYNDIQLLVNGQSKAFTFFRGVLSAEVDLKNDENTIIVKATNKDGSDEATVLVTYTPPLPKPDVAFVIPRRQGTNVETDKTTIEATVKNVSRKEDISIKVNGKPIKGFDFNPRTNKVSALITLVEGENSLLIEGKNATGTSSANSSVKYVKPMIQVVNTPKVEIISVSQPTVDPFDPERAKSTIIAKMENISAKKQITFTVNDQVDNGFSYDPKTQTFQTTINIGKGKTRVKISVQNADGSDEASRTITF